MAHLQASSKEDDSNTTDTQSEIYKAAQAHANSYANVMRLAAKGVEISKIAQQIHAHYGPKFVSFALGYVVSIPGDSPESIPEIANHLDRFKKAGFGLDIEMVKLRVDVYSEYAAGCQITWKIRPEREGLEPWEWMNLYGFRRVKNSTGGGDRDEGKERGYWEYAVSDNEMANLLQRAPNFLEL
jgi:hypothetical protein